MVGKEDERQDTPISTNTTTAAAPQFEIIPYNQNIIFAQNFIKLDQWLFVLLNPDDRKLAGLEESTEVCMNGFPAIFLLHYMKGIPRGKCMFTSSVYDAFSSIIQPIATVTIHKSDISPYALQSLTFLYKHDFKSISNEQYFERNLKAAIMYKLSKGMSVFSRDLRFALKFLGISVNIEIQHYQTNVQLNAKQKSSPENLWLKYSLGRTKLNVVSSLSPSDQKSHSEAQKLKEMNKLRLFGLDKIVEDITLLCKLRHDCEFESVTKHILLNSCFGILLSGASGTGKTTIAKIVSRDLGLRLHVLNLFQFQNNPAKIVEFFENILRVKENCIILIENIETLRRETKSSDARSANLYNYSNAITLMNYFDKMVQDKEYFVIATSSDPDSIDQDFLRPNRLGQEFCISPPDRPTRQLIANDIIKNLNFICDRKSYEDILSAISMNTSGFTAADISNLIGHSIVCFNKDKIKSNISEFSAKYIFQSLKIIKPTVMRSVTIQVPTVTFADIGGYQQVKQQIMQAIDWPQKYGESLKNLGLETPKGIILYGPPGCCKTMLAKAVANETSTNFLSINASELMSKYVGESEKSIRRYFLRARAAAPAIIFFDEFDSIASKRSSGEENAKYQDSIIGTLLTEIDGIEPLNNVVIIAATNRIDKIDEALLRPGRFDRKILVDRPNCDDRHEIIEILCKKYKIDMSKSKLNAKDFEGLSGAEIVNAFKEAGLRSFAENMHTDCINIDYIAEHVRNLSI